MNNIVDSHIANYYYQFQQGDNLYLIEVYSLLFIFYIRNFMKGVAYSIL